MIFTPRFCVGKLRKRIFCYSIFALLLFLGSVFVFGEAGKARAGFGITPPYVQNDRLTRNSSYEQEILLVRNNPVDDLKVDITLNVPEIESWFSIDRGTEFIFAKGETQAPIVISVKVPADAEYKEYTGSIRIRTSPTNLSPEKGGVSIALGAQVDVDLKVVDKILDFTVKAVKAADAEEGYKKWTLSFPGKLRLIMEVKNTGNVKFGPTKTKLEIYDYLNQNLLETTYNSNKIKQIEPFVSEDVVAELPTQLKAGRYLAKFTIFKNDEIAKQGEVAVSILPFGSMVGYIGYDFFDGLWVLSVRDKIKVVSVLGFAVIIIAVLLTALIRRRRRRKRQNNNSILRETERQDLTNETGRRMVPDEAPYHSVRNEAGRPLSRPRVPSRPDVINLAVSSSASPSLDKLSNSTPQEIINHRQKKSFWRRLISPK